MNKIDALNHRKQLVDRAHDVVHFFLSKGMKQYTQYFQVACPDADLDHIKKIFNLIVEPASEPTLLILEREMERLRNDVAA